MVSGLSKLPSAVSVGTTLARFAPIGGRRASVGFSKEYANPGGFEAVVDLLLSGAGRVRSSMRALVSCDS